MGSNRWLQAGCQELLGLLDRSPDRVGVAPGASYEALIAPGNVHGEDFPRSKTIG